MAVLRDTGRTGGCSDRWELLAQLVAEMRAGKPDFDGAVVLDLKQTAAVGRGAAMTGLMAAMTAAVVLDLRRRAEMRLWVLRSSHGCYD
jgi:hypothetical protein